MLSPNWVSRCKSWYLAGAWFLSSRNPAKRLAIGRDFGHWFYLVNSDRVNLAQKLGSHLTQVASMAQNAMRWRSGEAERRPLKNNLIPMLFRAGTQARSDTN